MSTAWKVKAIFCFKTIFRWVHQVRIAHRLASNHCTHPGHALSSSRIYICMQFSMAPLWPSIQRRHCLATPMSMAIQHTKEYTPPAGGHYSRCPWSSRSSTLSSMIDAHLCVSLASGHFFDRLTCKGQAHQFKPRNTRMKQRKMSSYA